MNEPGKKLYFELIKLSISGMLNIDDPFLNQKPIDLRRERSGIKSFVLKVISSFLSRYKIELVEGYTLPWRGDVLSVEETRKRRELGEDWPVRAESMIGMKRLDNLQHCVESVIKEGVPGDLVESGVWRGGAVILMRAIIAAYDVKDRIVWAADSFEGLPPPNSTLFPEDAGDKHFTYSELAVSLEEVKRNFQKYRLLDEQVRFLKGWFKDTISEAPIEQIAVLRLDGDMYESTIQVIAPLYDRVSAGGYIIVDDYHLGPCRKAIDDFREQHQIVDEIIAIDNCAVYWRKKLEV